MTPNIFETGIKTLRKNKIIQAIILGSLIVNTAPTYAKEMPKQPTTIETTIDDFNIIASPEFNASAQIIKNILTDLTNENPYTNYLVSQIKINDIRINVNPDPLCQLADYDIKTKTINLNPNYVATAKNDDVKTSIVHELVHMTHYKSTGTGDIIEDLNSTDQILMNLMLEITAYTQSSSHKNFDLYATDTTFPTILINNMLTLISDGTMNNYINDYIIRAKKRITNVPTKNFQTALESINNQEFYKYDFSKINKQDILNLIPSDLKIEIQKLETIQIAYLNQNAKGLQ